MDNIIGENIRKLRIENSLTQGELSLKCGVSLSALNKYERGDRIPKIESLEKIAEALNVQVDYILGKSQYKNLGSHIINEDILHIIEKIDGSNKEFAELAVSIVDTMFLTIYHQVADQNTEYLKIIKGLYKNINYIKSIQKNSLKYKLLDTDFNNSDEVFKIYKEEINILLDKLYNILK